MAFDFTNIVSKYASEVTVLEEVSGYYDSENGGKWVSKNKSYDTQAAVFNLSGRDIKGFSLDSGDGGAYSSEDIKIYIHTPIKLKSTVIYKGKEYVVTSTVDYSGFAKGLQIYIAKRRDTLDTSEVSVESY